MTRDARAAAEEAARGSYGRLLAYLSARSGDVAAAEDALADAFASALKTWPERGVPDNPDAWLLTAARRRLIDGARRAATREVAAADLTLLAEEAQAGANMRELPDDRLKLLFVCAHPAIDPAARTPLMLQTVLGLDAARIASAFLVSPAAMGQRLVRAKAKIRAARVPFEPPGPEEARARLGDVLEAVYAVYGTGWEDAAGADPRRRGLADEAVWLARLLTRLAPEHAEAGGLLALLLYCEARRPARRGEGGAYVALSDQDPRIWDAALIVEAEGLLRRALAGGDHGRFQLEAAIQSAHAARAVTGRTDWTAVAVLYDRLVEVSPTLGACVGRAAAQGEAHGPEAGLAALDEIPEKRVAAYQPYWATRAHLLSLAGRKDDARAAYDRAVGLSEDPAVRAFLLKKAGALTET
ncbi:MAG: RNA polymerase subunit sigma-24 [Caulobacterales bacterium]|nr:RNA polymerase subunit sigma-24 [Caulobacterales bacterium]